VKDFNPADYMDSKGARRMSLFAQYAVAAAQLAADDAGLVLTDAERPKAASAIATGSGGAIDTMEESEVLNTARRKPGQPVLHPDDGAEYGRLPGLDASRAARACAGERRRLREAGCIRTSKRSR